jgi:hypothetical protein
MAQSFDIRFAKSAGIAALFEAAENSFGWKGDGRLSIDAQGMSFALKRGIASLLAHPRPRSQRIRAESIKDVYREGESVRIEFTTDENPRAVLPFWTRDRDTAAQIVQLLPTSRTIELENAADPIRERKMARRTPLMLALAMILVVASGALFIRNLHPVVVAPAMVATTSGSPLVPESRATAQAASTPVVPNPVPTSSMAVAPRPVHESDRFTTPDEARKLAMLAEDPVDWTASPPSSARAVTEAAARDARMALVGVTEDAEVEGFVPMEIPGINVPLTVVPIKQTSLAYATARELLDAFEAEARTLDESYRREREAFDKETLDIQTFADRLDALEPRWRRVSDTTLQNRAYNDLSLTSLRATLLTVVIQQRVFLTGYAAGLRAGDQDRIERAFKDLARAESMLARARQYVN